MKLKNKLKLMFIAGSLAGIGLNLTSCKIHELCSAYKSYANKNNIEIKNEKQNCAFYNYKDKGDYKSKN